MTEYEFLKWIGGRKFILSLITLLMTAALLIFGVVDMDTYQMVVLWVVSVYITGNVVQKMSN
jgi:hypothetical protein